MDEWMQTNVDPEVLDSLATVPLPNRKAMIVKIMREPKENMNAWLRACVRNYETELFEKSLRPTPTPQGVRRTVPAESARQTSSWVPAPAASPAPGASTSASQEVANKTMATAFSKGPSRFLGAVIGALPSELQSPFLTLEPKVQVQVGFAAMMLEDSSHDFRAIVHIILTRHAALTPGPSSLGAAGADSVVAGGSLKLQCVLVGGELGIGSLMLHVVAGCLGILRPDMAVTFQPTIHAAYNDFNDALLTSLGKQIKIPPSRPSSVAAAALPELITAESSQWKQEGVRLLFVVFLPTGNDPDEEPFLGSRGLHTRFLRSAWSVRKAMDIGIRTLGRAGIASVTFTPPGWPTPMQEDLRKVFGGEVTLGANQLAYHKYHAIPQVYTVPGKIQVVKNCEKENFQMVMDGWQADSDAIDTLVADGKSIDPFSIVQLSTTELFGERLLNEAEQNFVKALKVVHAQPNGSETRLMPRPFWYQIYGLGKTPLPPALHEMLPCARWIIASTGQVCTPAMPGGQACGFSRYCLNCEQVLSRMRYMFHLSVLSDIVTSVVLKSAKTWVEHGGDEDWPSGHDLGDHDCGVNCPENPQRGQ